MDKTVSFYTLGCRLNLSETGQIAQKFQDKGYKIVTYGEKSDITFLNTCTVTDGADSSCRNIIRKSKKISPEGKVVVAGCYSQMHAEKIKSMPDVDLILGTNEKFKVLDYIEENDNQADTVSRPLDKIARVHLDKNKEFMPAKTSNADTHTRGFLKIQDGCNYICSFCIIPFARGRSRTISVESAKREALKLVNDGFKEIILTGVNIGEYEATSGEKLSDLVKCIVKIDKLERLRLSSVEPNTIDKELLDTLKVSGKYQDHFHIPLQSGSDKILKSMRRKYDVAFYKKVINLVKEYFPNCSIGADIIAGYPGESEQDFMDTFTLLKELPITHFHVFPYSKRKNTTAQKSSEHISSDVKKKRVRTLINLGEEKLEKLKMTMLGSTHSVLFEKEIEENVYEGLTSNYLKVRAESSSDLRNTIQKVCINSSESSYLFGEIIV